MSNRFSLCITDMIDKRDNYLSTVKALGIIFMVIGHSGCPDFLSRMIYYFHMPLFFFCSGYFFRLSELNDLLAKIVKKMRGLYYPYLKWALCFLVLHNVFYNLGIYNSVWGYNGHVFHEYNIIDMILRFLCVSLTMEKHEPLLGGFWFLKTLLLSSLLVLFLTTLINHAKVKWGVLQSGLLIVFLLFVFKYVGLTVEFIGDFSVIFMGAFFYILGYIYHQRENVILYNGYVIVLFFMLLGLIAMYSHTMSMYCSFEDTFIYILVSLIGIIGTYGIAYQIERTRIKSFFYFIGKHTLEVLALHFLAFKLVSYIIIKIYSLPNDRLSELPIVTFNNYQTWYFYSLFGICLPLISVWVYNFLYSFMKKTES